MSIIIMERWCRMLTEMSPMALRPESEPMPPLSCGLVATFFSQRKKCSGSCELSACR